MPKLLLIEDDITLAGRVKEWFTTKNFNVEIATDGTTALSFLTHYEYDAIILDLGLPGINGIELCKTFRSLRGQTPILILTGKMSIEDKTVGFAAGADDYLTKPFAIEELSLRIQALLRRAPYYRESTLRAANLELLPHTHRVMVEGCEVKLFPLESDLLELFMRNPGVAFSPETLLGRVWISDSEASVDTIRTYIKTLRKKIFSEKYPCLIQTIYGEGYRFDG